MAEETALVRRRPLLFPGSGSQSFPELDHSGRTRWVWAGGNCVTFMSPDEDHMLGNALQYMVMKNPDVEFCGYCITHPSESKINFQIQTREEHEGVQGPEGGRDTVAFRDGSLHGRVEAWEQR